MTTDPPPPPDPLRLARVVLVGYRGTGKSTVGRLLASRLGWAYTDSDERVETVAGRSIADIFREEGESGFRDRESAALRELCAADRRVIATGGGAILRPANRELLTAAGFVAWLTATAETVWQRMVDDPTTAGRRPNLTPAGGLREVVEVLAAREPLYRAVADAVIPTDSQSPESVAAAILSAWDAWPGRPAPVSPTG